MKPLDHLTIPEAAKMLGVGTPCVRAMIHRGDVITAIDGRPAAKFTLEQVRQLFRQPGRDHHRTIGRPARVGVSGHSAYSARRAIEALIAGAKAIGRRGSWPDYENFKPRIDVLAEDGDEYEAAIIKLAEALRL